MPAAMGVLTSFLLLGAQVAAAEPVPALIHTFNDWSVACDNANRCQAVSLVPENPKPLAGEAEQEGRPGQPGHADFDPWERFGNMRFDRDAGPDGQLLITIFDFEGTPAKLIHYGRALNVRFEPHGEGGEFRIVPTDQEDFFSALLGDPVVVEDSAGKTLAWIATEGASDALAYMDERQGRVRTITALAERGLRPASVVPPAPALPVVTVARPTAERPLAIPRRRMDQARTQFGCREEDVSGPQVNDGFALGGGRTLILMSCGLAAYNANALPLIAWREGSTIRIGPARFDLAREAMEEKANGSDRYYLTNAEFDPATATLSEYAKGRGLGDCGVSADYGWDGERFRLLEQRAMSECRGTRDLLTTWRAERR
jgi:hypothetical protein